MKFANNFIIYQKSSLRGRLGLAGYTQSSGTGELKNSRYDLIVTNFWTVQFSDEASVHIMRWELTVMEAQCGGDFAAEFKVTRSAVSGMKHVI